jgi:hypothetical protein
MGGSNSLRFVLLRVRDSRIERCTDADYEESENLKKEVHLSSWILSLVWELFDVCKQEGGLDVGMVISPMT